MRLLEGKVALVTGSSRGESTLGPIDILVANAGASLTRPHLAIEEIDEAGWRESVDANLTATFLTFKSVLPGMKARRRGNIITMSSAAARRPTAFSPIPYAAAKAGIQALTQLVAAQAGPAGIRVTCRHTGRCYATRGSPSVQSEKRHAG